MKDKNKIGILIGVIGQIKDDRHLSFIANNEVKCNIGDIIGVYNKDNSTILAIITEITLEYYLENAKSFFISKAVSNNIQQLNELKHKPKYGQIVSAQLLVGNR